MLSLSSMSQAGPRTARRRSAFALCLVVTVGLAGCGGNGGLDDSGEATPSGDAVPTTVAWVDFRSDEGRFRVEMPNQPDRSQQDVPVGDGSLRLILFTANVNDSVAYNVGFVDYPEAITEADPATVLDGVVQGAAQQVSGTVVSKTPTTANGSPAVDYVVGAQGGQVQARAILVANRLYILQGASKEPDPDGFGRLATSFELLPA